MADNNVFSFDAARCENLINSWWQNLGWSNARAVNSIEMYKQFKARNEDSVAFSVWGLDIVKGGFLQINETAKLYRRALVFNYEAALYEFKSNFEHDMAVHFCKEKSTFDCLGRKNEFLSAVTTEAKAEDAMERAINVLINEGDIDTTEQLYKNAQELHRTALERLFVAAKLECK